MIPHQMITFKQFLREGGNVRVGDESADRIDLKKLSRKAVVKELRGLLADIASNFKAHSKKELWSKSLLTSGNFLSGSAFHFFNDAIDDKTFGKSKPSVGDVDTQVPEELGTELEAWLKTEPKLKDGDLIGFKKSAGQLITLWRLNGHSINVQIDLELVPFENGEPTEWSSFSHSSDWEDLKAGVKGVAHKYLLRALQAPKLREVVILPKTERGKPKEVLSSEFAFSVTNGLRRKLKPALDSAGKQRFVDGKPAFYELSTSESVGTADVAEVFRAAFGRAPSSADKKRFGSFIGLADLIADELPKKDQAKIVDGFAHTLWSPAAQGLYRGDPKRDEEEKQAMLELLATKLGVDPSKYDDQRASYYKSYKIT